jgi:hypothetical protein
VRVVAGGVGERAAHVAALVGRPADAPQVGVEVLVGSRRDGGQSHRAGGVEVGVRRAGGLHRQDAPVLELDQALGPLGPEAGGQPEAADQVPGVGAVAVHELGAQLHRVRRQGAVGPHPAADAVAGLQHHHPQSRVAQVAAGLQAGDPGAEDEDVRRRQVACAGAGHGVAGVAVIGAHRPRLSS